MLGLAGALAIGAVILPFPVGLDVIDTSILLIDADDVQAEDAYVASQSGRVDGRIEGDLVIATGDLTIDGVVTGDVFVISTGTVRIGGSVEGAVRGIARSIVVSGFVGDDVAVVAASVDVSGSIGRDLLVAGGRAVLDGGVGRDVRGRMFTIDVGGAVGRDIDVTARTVSLQSTANVAGDLVYRADATADIADGATVGGVASQLSARGSFLVRLYLTIANAVGFVLFVLFGFLALWVFRGSASRAAGVVVTRPLRALLVGLGVGVASPLAIVAVVLLVGSALSAVVVATLVGLLVLAALVLGPIPALAAVGDLITRRRGGIFGGFVVAAIAWRLLIWAIPLLGALVGLALYALGIGGWITAGWGERRAALADAPMGPARLDSVEPVPDDWEPPLPPA